MENQRGLAWIPILIVITLALIALCVGIFVTREPRRSSFSSPKIVASAVPTLPDNVITTTSTSSSSGTPDPVTTSKVSFGASKTFTSAQYRFSITYPSLLTIDSKDSLFNVTIPAKNNEGPATVSVNTSGNTRDCLLIPAATDERRITDNGSVLINGVSFRSATADDVAMGHGHSKTTLSTIFDGACYVITSMLDTYTPSRLDTSEQRAAKEYVQVLQDTVHTIVHSFRLTPLLHDPEQTADVAHYEHPDLGFTFWLPQNWQVRFLEKRLYQYGATITTYSIGDVISLSVIDGIPESVTDDGKEGKYGPVTYSYDNKTTKWMVTWPEGAPETGSTETTVAPVAFRTMSGLPIFTGSSHFGSMFIPLSPTQVLYIRDEGVVDSRYLALTIAEKGSAVSKLTQFNVIAQMMREFLGK